MNNHLEEFSAAMVGFFTYILSHKLGLRVIDANILQTGYDLGNKFINLLFGVVTACIAYLAVYLIKKYITKESK